MENDLPIVCAIVSILLTAMVLCLLLVPRDPERSALPRFSTKHGSIVKERRRILLLEPEGKQNLDENVPEKGSQTAMKTRYRRP